MINDKIEIAAIPDFFESGRWHCIFTYQTGTGEVETKAVSIRAKSAEQAIAKLVNAKNQAIRIIESG